MTDLNIGLVGHAGIEIGPGLRLPVAEKGTQGEFHQRQLFL